MQANFEVHTRENGEVEVVVRPAAARPFRLVGFSSQRSAEDWVRTRVAREDRHIAPSAGDEPAAVTEDAVH